MSEQKKALVVCALRMSKEMLDQYRELAERDSTGVSSVMRKALAQYLKRRKS